MRLDEAGADPHVCLGEMPVDQRGRAGFRRAELLKRGGIFRLVVQHPVIARDGRGKHLLKFRARVGAVRAEGVEQRDPLAGHVAQFLKQPGNQAIVRGGARDVGEHDADPVTAAGPLAQRRRADWMRQGVADRRALVRQTGQVRRLDDGGLSFWQVHRQFSLAVSKMHFHGQT